MLCTVLYSVTHICQFCNGIGHTRACQQKGSTTNLKANNHHSAGTLPEKIPVTNSPWDSLSRWEWVRQLFLLSPPVSWHMKANDPGCGQWPKWVKRATREGNGSGTQWQMTTAMQASIQETREGREDSDKLESHPPWKGVSSHSVPHLHCPIGTQASIARCPCFSRYNQNARHFSYEIAWILLKNFWNTVGQHYADRKTKTKQASTGQMGPQRPPDGAQVILFLLFRLVYLLITCPLYSF